MLKNVLTTVVILLSTATEAAEPPKSTQNCISNYYVVDSNGQCIGDLISPSPPNTAATVARQFGDPPTLYAITGIGLTGFVPNVTFFYPTTDCTGQAFMQAKFGFGAVFQMAEFDGNGVFWAPNPTIQTTITIRSALEINLFNPPERTCLQQVGTQLLVGTAEQVDSTFANTVVPPLVAACQIFDPDRSTSKGACKVRSDH
jgi:hypothetical protein